MSAGFLLIAILIAVLFLIVSGGVAAIIVTSIVRKKRNARAPQTSVEATVLEKKETVVRHPVAGDAAGAHGYTKTSVYRVTVLTAENIQMTLDADAELFDCLREGDRGRLTYRGTQLIGFQRSQM